MATEKELKSRLLQKHDTEANWIKATGFTPKEGEIIIYDTDASHLYPRVKIGNGKNNVNNLPFIQSQVADKLATQRLIQLTGDVTGSAYFDGSKAITIDTSLNDQIKNTAIKTLLFVVDNNNQILELQAPEFIGEGLDLFAYLPTVNCYIVQQNDYSFSGYVLQPENAMYSINEEIGAAMIVFSGVFTDENNQQVIKKLTFNLMAETEEETFIFSSTPIGSQGDWNQNDETAPDYIKNRTHYIGYTNEVEIIPTTTTSIETSGLIANTEILEAGKTYKVTWNGVNYYDTIKEVFEDGEKVGSYIGSDEIVYNDLDNISNSKFPFAVVCLDGVTIAIDLPMALKGATATVAISTVDTVAHPLDEVFIPDTIARIDDITDLTSIITQLQTKIIELEAALANKQDKIYNWGDLADGSAGTLNVAEEGL